MKKRLSSCAYWMSDVSNDNDGAVNAADALGILKIVVGK